jgi:hypothetical protein
MQKSSSLLFSFFIFVFFVSFYCKSVPSLFIYFIVNLLSHFSFVLMIDFLWGGQILKNLCGLRAAGASMSAANANKQIEAAAQMGIFKEMRPERNGEAHIL